MPRTSRTARASRAAAAVCPLAPSLLLLPLVVGAFLAGLWLLGAAPASAQDGSPFGGRLGTGALAGGSLGEGPLTHAVLGGGLDTSSLDLRDPGSLEEVVPGEVAEPVSSTLDGVQHRLEQGAERTAAGTATVLPEAPWPVDGVGEGARRVVRELDRDRTEDVLAPVSPPKAEPDPATAPEERSGQEPPASGAPRRPAPVRTSHTVLTALPATETSVETAEPEAAPAVPASSTVQLTPGSAAPGGGAPAPGIAGYLTTVPVAAPAADAVLLAAHALHPVPGGPSDDPTVSPD
ncbi:MULTISPECIES: flagellar associated protein [unclassified Nocardiopsis]|uniref:flagellar associated protein n=1 Tax=unclassified Nocardiopsis TaxID=2649073 RepID=UPI00135B93CC|nr:MULTISPECIES: flagellar associated protein [unclassified Nocardiopsis]